MLWAPLARATRTCKAPGTTSSSTDSTSPRSPPSTISSMGAAATIRARRTRLTRTGAYQCSPRTTGRLCAVCRQYPAVSSRHSTLPVAHGGPGKRFKAPSETRVVHENPAQTCPARSLAIDRHFVLAPYGQRSQRRSRIAEAAQATQGQGAPRDSGWTTQAHRRERKALHHGFSGTRGANPMPSASASHPKPTSRARALPRPAGKKTTRGQGCGRRHKRWDGVPSPPATQIELPGSIPLQSMVVRPPQKRP